MRLPLSWLLLLASTLPPGLTTCLPSTASLQAPQDTSTPFQNRSHLAQSISPSEAYSDESLKTYQDRLTLARAQGSPTGGDGTCWHWQYLPISRKVYSSR